MAVAKSVRIRAGLVGFLLFALFGGLAVRLYAIQVRGHAAADARKSAQSVSHVLLDRPRGAILDARGEVLAVSVPGFSLWADPRRLTPEAVTELAAALSLPISEIQRRLSLGGKEFAWLQRHLSEEETRVVRDLAQRRPGIGLSMEYDRRYPRGELACHVLGIVNVDEKGQEGVERRKDGELDGAILRKPVQVDGLRRILDLPEDPWAGSVVTLTIVAELQQIVEEELKNAVREHRPKWATAIVMDPRTGAILAMANSPSFDPNRPKPGPALQNLAVIAPYEPGSTIKVFFAAAALEEGLVTPATVFDCENGLWKYGPTLLHDHHPYARLTLVELIAKSSNIGAAKIGALFLGKERLYRWAREFGFGAPTGIDLPGEDEGVLHPLQKWTPYFSVTRIPIGQEISVTPIQLITAMAAIANGGEWMKPYVVQRVEREDGTLVTERRPIRARQVLSAKTCAAMTSILIEAVKNGTGKEAQVEGIQVAGKTGTTQLKDRRGNLFGYIGSFVGFAPAEAPRFCIAVVLSQTQGEYYGGKVAAPVAKRIIERGNGFAR